MKFVPKQIVENVNVTPKAPLKEALWITFGLVLIIVLCYTVSGILVDLAVPYIPYHVEEKIAKLFNRSFHKSNEKHKSLDKLTALVSELNKLSREDKRNYSVRILSDSRFNAFALPGGTILILEGLLEKVKSEQELAFVLCHEIGHFKNRDHLKTLGRKLLGFTLMTFIFGGNNPLNSTMKTTINKLNLTHSKTQELAADRFAFELLYKKYGSVKGAFSFFRNLEKNENLPSILYFFSTHPKPEERIAQLKKFSAEKGIPKQ